MLNGELMKTGINQKMNEDMKCEGNQQQLKSAWQDLTLVAGTWTTQRSYTYLVPTAKFLAIL